MTMSQFKNLRWPLGLVLGVFVALLDAGCERDGTSDARVGRTCESYCSTVAACDDDVDEDDCVSRCENTMEDCMADEQEHALDDLDSCAEESCDDVGACRIGAGLQCTFGL